MSALLLLSQSSFACEANLNSFLLFLFPTVVNANCIVFFPRVLSFLSLFKQYFFQGCGTNNFACASEVIFEGKIYILLVKKKIFRFVFSQVAKQLYLIEQLRLLMPGKIISYTFPVEEQFETYGLLSYPFNSVIQYEK